jgi:hypothetical protein
MEVRQPWDRQEDESEKAFAAFVRYRDLGAERTLSGAYREQRGRKSEQQGRKPGAKGAQREPGRWRKWFNDFHWKARVSAWDQRLQSVEQQKRESEVEQRASEWARRREEVRESKWRLGEKMLKRAESMVDWPLAETKTERDGKTVILTPANWTRLHAAAALAREGNGLTREAVDSYTATQEDDGLAKRLTSLTDPASIAAAQQLLVQMEGVSGNDGDAPKRGTVETGSPSAASQRLLNALGIGKVVSAASGDDATPPR